MVVRKFGPDTFQESELTNIDDLPSLRDQPVCLWVEVTGLANTGLVAAIGRVFGLHVLSLEDVLDPNQRPKVEHYDDYTFVVLKVLGMSARVEVHPLYILFGDRFVVTLQDIDNPVLEPVRERLRRASGKIRARGPDYLAYALVDTVIDHYFPVVEAFDDHLERVEDAVLEATNVDPIDLARRAR
ncbi:MAG: magnesium and cobalt transport protein CorA, partial [Deltaproteobacteria bacterium]|nr:magnesium and cobalt transport protein CorA [Deltaproteobacteria bacterium]